MEGFKTLIHDTVDTDYDRMSYLKMFLTPRIRVSIKGMLKQPSQYMKALNTLREKYGSPELLIKAATKIITNLPNARAGDSRSLETFMGGLEEAIAALEHADQPGETQTAVLAQIALTKLPREIRSRWGIDVAKHRQESSLDGLIG